MNDRSCRVESLRCFRKLERNRAMSLFGAKILRIESRVKVRTFAINRGPAYRI